MTTPTTDSRLLTELDFVRLNKLQGGRLPETLADELRAADVVPSREIAPDVVTMYSQVELAFGENGPRQKITLCYPADAEPAQGFVSVLSPVGSALLGLRVGDTAAWQMPGGEQRSARIAALLFQPEASGDYTT